MNYNRLYAIVGLSTTILFIGLIRINKLLIDIDRNGYQCSGKLEALSGNLAGYWSVRIDEKNRIVFRITGDSMEIIQCGTHYRDK